MDTAEALNDPDILVELSMDYDALEDYARACKDAARLFSKASQLSGRGHDFFQQGMEEDDAEKRAYEVDEAEEFERSYFPRR